MPDHIQLNRKFSLFTSSNDNPEPAEINWDDFSWETPSSNSLIWKDLLSKDKVVILAEAGTGKTDELRAMASELAEKGKTAFFCRIELLAEPDLDFEMAWDIGDDQQFNDWKNTSDNDLTAYFFLDSVDEAKLQKARAFDIALRRFVSAIGKNNLKRAKIFVTSRFSEWIADSDLQIFCNAFNISTPNVQDNNIVYKLESLTDEQICTFASARQIDSPSEFLDAIEKADAKIFASRPQDLIDLISYWKGNDEKLGRHIEVLEYSIKQKLCESNPDRKGKDTLSPEEALKGAERLAAATIFMKKNKIHLPNNQVNDDIRAISINPQDILPEWEHAKLSALLTRPIFDEAIYGAVRFHHRSVREFLAAKWLLRLLNDNGSRRKIEALLITEQYGRKVAIPSMQAVAAWLACWDDKIRQHLERVAPEVLIEKGDPSEFPVEYRIRLLDKVVKQYQHQQSTDLNIDPMMMKRLADPEMAEAINKQLRSYSSHYDLSRMLLKMVWYGEIQGSVEEASHLIFSPKLGQRIQKIAFQTVLAVGTEQQKQTVIRKLMDGDQASRKIVGRECSKLFPDYLSLDDLVLIIEASPQTERHSSPSLHYQLQLLTSNENLSNECRIEILEAIHPLIRREPYFKNYDNCNISKSYAWIIRDALSFARPLFKHKDELSFNLVVLDFIWAYLVFDSHSSYGNKAEKVLNEIRQWNELTYKVYWYAVCELKKTQQFKPWRVNIYLKGLWKPKLQDWKALKNDLRVRTSYDEKLVALDALFLIYDGIDKTSSRLNKLKIIIKGFPKLSEELERWINPPALSEEALKNQKENEKYEEEAAAYKKEKENTHKDWKQHIQKHPDYLLNIGDPSNGDIWQEGWYINNWLRKKEESIGQWAVKGTAWELLIDEFSEEVAVNFRQGCIAYWRAYNPCYGVDVQRQKDIPNGRLIGLTGLSFEASFIPNWMELLSNKEVLRAASFAMLEINGFPEWLPKLYEVFPDLVKKKLLEEVQYELSDSFDEAHPTILERIGLLKIDISGLSGHILTILESIPNSKNSSVKYALAIILKCEISTEMNERLSTLACSRFGDNGDFNTSTLWLRVLFFINANKAMIILKTCLYQLRSEELKQEVVISFFANFDNQRGPLPIINSLYLDYQRIEILEHLLPLAYQYIRLENDIRRSVSGAYRSGEREKAQRMREYLLELLSNIPEQKAYSVLQKLLMLTDDNNHKDYLLTLIKHRAETDSEFTAWKENDISEFSSSSEINPKTEKDLFQLAMYCIHELKDDLEKGDESIASSIQLIKGETELRNWLAREFKKVSNGKYEIAQEEEMADAKRTDIRFHIPSINPVPVELKIADKWSFNKLFERMENQLIGQYMKVSQYGIFLLVYRGTTGWKDDDGKIYTFLELIKALQRHEKTLIEKYDNVANLKVVGIDLTLRNLSSKRPKNIN